MFRFLSACIVFLFLDSGAGAGAGAGAGIFLGMPITLHCMMSVMSTPPE